MARAAGVWRMGLVLMRTLTADFDRIGAAFEATGAARTGPVGEATARLMGQRAVVDFATAWIAAHREPAAG